MKSAERPQSRNTSGAMELAAPFTIHQNAQAAKVSLAHQLRQPVGILLPELLFARQHAGCGNRRVGSSFGELLEMSKDVGLDFMLELVGKLVTVGAEDFNAVVLPGIVRG